MESSGSPSKKAVALTVLGIFLFILYLYYFVGFEDILNVIRNVDPVVYVIYYSLTAVAALLSIVFFALTWHELLKSLSINFKFKEVMLYCLVARFVDLLLPTEAVSGELARLYLASRRGDGEGFVGKLTASLVVHRLLCMTITLAGLMIGSTIVFFSYKVPDFVSNLLLTVSAGTFFTIVLLLYLSFKVDKAIKLTDLTLQILHKLLGSRINIQKWRSKAFETIEAFNRGINIVRKDAKALIKPLIYAVISWFLHLSTYQTVFYALGVNVSFPVSIVVFSISVAVQTVPIGLPVGLVEIVMATLYVLFKIDIAVSGTATALIRAITFWFELFVGYVAAQWLGIKMVFKEA